jgi:hypothetical protein
MRSLALQPGRLRSVLSDYIVELLSMPPLPVTYQLPATWLQSFTVFGTCRRSPPPPHPNRTGTAFLGTHFISNIFFEEK